MAIGWSADLSVGMRELDLQHEALFELIGDAVSRAAGTDAAAAVRALSDVADGFYRHFAAEESLMEASDYAERVAHKRAHDLFLQDLGMHIAQAEIQGVTADLVSWMQERLSSWFVFHIGQNDVPMARHILHKTGRPAEPMGPPLKPVRQ